jgi:hypothetical protein
MLPALLASNSTNYHRKEFYSRGPWQEPPRIEDKKLMDILQTSREIQRKKGPPLKDEKMNSKWNKKVDATSFCQLVVSPITKNFTYSTQT